MILEVVGCRAPVGARCRIETDKNVWLEAEVVGFNEDRLFVMPLGNLQGVAPGLRVVPLERVARLPVGRELLGRIFDGNGRLSMLAF